MKLDATLELYINLAYEQGYLTNRYCNFFQRWAMTIRILRQEKREEQLAIMAGYGPHPGVNISANGRMKEIEIADPDQENSEPMSLLEVQNLEDYIEQRLSSGIESRSAVLDDEEGWI